MPGKNKRYGIPVECKWLEQQQCVHFLCIRFTATHALCSAPTILLSDNVCRTFSQLFFTCCASLLFFFRFFSLETHSSTLKPSAFAILWESLNIDLKKKKCYWKRDEWFSEARKTERSKHQAFGCTWKSSIAHLISERGLTFSFWPNIVCFTFSLYLLILDRLKLDFVSSTCTMYLAHVCSYMPR